MIDMEYSTCVPDVCNNVTLDGTSLSPVFDDRIYDSLHGIEAGNIKLKELGRIGNSPDHGYESDSIGGSTSTDFNYTNEINSIHEILSREAEYVEYPNVVTTNDNMFTVHNIGPKIEPVDCERWYSFSSPSESLSYLQSPTTTSPLVSSVCQTTTTDMYQFEPDIMDVVKQEPQQMHVYPNQYCYIPPNDCNTTNPDLEISDSEDEDFTPSIQPEMPATNRRRRKSTKQPILWKFLLDALNKPEEYESMIFWVNKQEGTFQFSSQHKEELSRQWGVAKRNRCTMTYQKMARALRNYINRNEVLRKVKRKLQYTFIPEFYASIQHLVVR